MWTLLHDDWSCSLLDWREDSQTPRQRGGCYKRLALLQHKVGYQLRMQSQHMWWVGEIAPLVVLIATYVCASWQVAVVTRWGLFVPLLLPLILPGVSGRGAACI